MRHLLFAVLLASCVDSSGDPEEALPLPDPEVATPDPGTPTPESPDDVIARWQQCMTFADFQSADMANSWAHMLSTGNMKCMNCHGTGAGGFIATTNAQQMFDVLKTQQYYLLQHITLAATAQGSYQVVVDTNSIPEAGLGHAPHAEHPTFNASAGMTAFRTFFQLTQSRCAGPF
jgi:hypothetical protein